ncbi:MAG: DUF6029 family protein [Flavobacteriales bacterium]|jgi:hypothetical protein|nr:hypothetical protein [Flavobacteriales bacterium]MCI1752163.1 DUF6029 family protein [Flavobacteriales bacterium]
MHPTRTLGLALATLALCLSGLLHAQDGGQIHGNFSTDGQLYNDDEQIGAVKPPADFGLNSWMNLNYRTGNFEAGARFESYEPALLGYPAGAAYNGTGVGYRYATFRKDGLEVTAGNFYEQFGQGLAFRTYEERALGVDNAMDGLRVKFNPDTGIYLKGIIGTQRFAFDNGTTKGAGIVRGLDGEISLAEAFPRLFPKLAAKGNSLIVGGSFVSKFQPDQDPFLELPENVGIWAGRANYVSAKWNLYSEYAYKINDPNGSNGNIYKPGQALMANATYSVRGLGISAGAHIFDNMVFQSDRGAPTLFDLNINYLPTLAKQHTYNLPATLYPYATQPNGEVAYQGEVFYKFKRGSKLGGKYGTKISANWSGAWSLDTTRLANDTIHLQGYSTNFFSMGDRQYFSDFNVELRKKLSANWELALTYLNLVYDIETVQGKAGKPVIYADMFILEGLHVISDKTSLRFELQHLATKQDHGNWATALAELTFSPHWFVAAMDQYNYGGSVETELIHYPIGTFGYIRGGSRFSFSYGRQRAGIFCVGGVCRVVPAANGLTASITTTF